MSCADHVSLGERGEKAAHLGGNPAEDLCRIVQRVAELSGLKDDGLAV
jgi:hypothetical protein